MGIIVFSWLLDFEFFGKGYGLLFIYVKDYIYTGQSETLHLLSSTVESLGVLAILMLFDCERRLCPRFNCIL
jgi:uncharacterized membrane protein YbhN (UPF0104 family)